MYLPCMLKINDNLSLSFQIHGMEHELPLEVDETTMQPDPRYPCWEVQLAHHKELNDAIRQARAQF